MATFTRPSEPLTRAAGEDRGLRTRAGGEVAPAPLNPRRIRQRDGGGGARAEETEPKGSEIQIENAAFVLFWFPLQTQCNPSRGAPQQQGAKHKRSASNHPRNEAVFLAQCGQSRVCANFPSFHFAHAQL